MERIVAVAVRAVVSGSQLIQLRGREPLHLMAGMDTAHMVAAEPVVLEERPPQHDYIRPPIEDQEFVPEVHRKFL